MRLYNESENALLIFTMYLLDLLSNEVVLTEGKIYFENYIYRMLNEIEYNNYEFTLSRPAEENFVHRFFEDKGES